MSIGSEGRLRGDSPQVAIVVLVAAGGGRGFPHSWTPSQEVPAACLEVPTKLVGVGTPALHLPPLPVTEVESAHSQGGHQHSQGVHAHLRALPMHCL